MTPLVTIELAGRPRGKGRPRFGNGRTFTDAKTAKYEGDLKWAARLAMGDRDPFTGAFVLEIVARFEIPRSWAKHRRLSAWLGEELPTGKPDWDNIGKMTDAFKNVVWTDDSAVVDGRVIKVYADEPGLTIRVGRP